MQAIGFNRFDRYIYGTNNNSEVVRFGLDLQPQVLYSGNVRYQTGDVDNNGPYWAIRTVDE